MNQETFQGTNIQRHPVLKCKQIYPENSTFFTCNVTKWFHFFFRPVMKQLMTLYNFKLDAVPSLVV